MMMPMVANPARTPCTSSLLQALVDIELSGVTVRVPIPGHETGAAFTGSAQNGIVTLRLGGPRTRLWIAVVLSVVCVGAVISVVVVRGYAADTPRTLTVMTRNIYLGGDINRPVRAALNHTGRDGELALGHASHELR